MLRKENLILTYAGGDAFCKSEGFKTFVQSVASLASSLPSTDLAVVTHQMPHEVREGLTWLGAEVVDFKDGETVLRDRHLAFWNYLNEHGHKYKYILISDSKDVVFQRNPFKWVEEWKLRFDKIQGNRDFLDHFVIFASEGFKMSRSGFACIEHFEFEKDVPKKFVQPERNRWVVNGGIMLGTPRALQDLVFLLWSVTLKSIGHITDQATLNWVMRFLEKDATYSVSHPQHDDFCIVCEGIKEEGVPLILKNGIAHNPQGNPYCIVHQWDRIPELRDAVLAQYGS